MKTTIALALATLAGAAQASERPDPSDPKAKGVPVEYRSAFADYRPAEEPKVGDWRRSNDEVRALGGHKGHVPRAAGEAKKPAAADPHAGHHK